MKIREYTRGERSRGEEREVEVKRGVVIKDEERTGGYDRR